MKYLKYLALAFVLFLIPFYVDAKEITLNLFRGEGCPHCAEEEEYLQELKKTYGDDLKIKTYEVWYNEGNSRLMEEVKEALDVKGKGVPFTVIGDQSILGYNDDISRNIQIMIKDAMKNENYYDAVSYVKDGKELPKKEEKEYTDSTKTVPILGDINAKEVSLPLAGAIIGLVDGFNPCAMWILLFLISMLLPTKDKRRKWILGITFLATSAVVYALFMVAWLNIALTAMQTVVIRNIIAIIALVGAIINLKSFLKDNDSGCTVVKDSKRKRIFDRIKKIVKEKSFILALLGIMALAFTVNLVELACSAGLPLLYTSILALNDLNVMEYAFNIFIYILFFLLDDIIVFTVAMKTLEVTGISTKYGKFSHLIGGILMFIIGVLMIFKPEWLMLGF